MGERPRKLLLVINELSRDGGAEAQLAHLAKGLADLGHTVTICCIDTAYVDLHSLTKRGVEVISLGVTSRGARARAIPRLARLARRADVVHCTMWDSSLWGRIAAILARRPVVVADHATDRAVQVATSGAQRGGLIALHNRLLDRFTFATVICATSQRQLLASEGVDPEKIVHIPNGIPVEEVVAAAAGGPAKAELGLPEGVPLAMHVGVFRPEKNQLGAVESFPRLLERAPDAHLVFVGDGEGRAQVERRAAEIAPGRIHFLGLRDDVPALLALADLMLLPSISDAMPMVVLEAMALGVPTVATDVGDVREVLGEGAGVCVPAGDDDAFAAASGELLSDPGRRAAISALAKDSVRGFDSAAMTHRYAALFEATDTKVSPIVAVSEAIPEAVA
jgi:glycosyltransferase involved in cell wall biosynthesis